LFQEKVLTMAKITIDGKDYDTDALSDEVKGNLAAMQFCDAELQRLQATAAALQTARMAYARGVSEGLNGPVKAVPAVNFDGDTIQFN
jgi:hypothetical protein